MKAFAIALSLIVISSVAWAGGAGTHSLRGDVALEAPSVQTTAKEWQDGEGKIQRNYAQQPPLVPHSTEDFPITRDDNSCLACHNWDSEMPGATKVAVSHFVDRDGEALSNISPNRYFCTQCHVPQKNAKPLLPSIFRSVAEE